jgi:hypothetical protein
MTTPFDAQQRLVTSSNSEYGMNVLAETTWPAATDIAAGRVVKAIRPALRADGRTARRLVGGHGLPWSITTNAALAQGSCFSRRPAVLWIESYTRIRYGRLEYVRGHFRRLPCS